jgi:Trk-type K+ transport system membrane component
MRLYWFEKRFRHVVNESRRWRQSRIDSRTRSLEIPHVDLEQGIQRERIRVLHPSGDKDKKEETNGGIDDKAQKGDKVEKEGKDEKDEKGTLDEENANVENDQIAPTTPFRRGIMFADEVETRGRARELSNSDRLPTQRPTEQHIAFVENQRNPKDKAALRIPGPRDVERGERPERIDPSLLRGATENAIADDSEDEAPTNKLTLPDIRYRRPRRPSVTTRGRASSIHSFISRTLSQNAAAEESDPQPYLSYTATIGRNSMFIDLTDEQREELGGIEYRALKTLYRVLLAYNIGWTLVGVIVWLPWIVHGAPGQKAIVEADGGSALWWGFFTPTSHFTDLGFTLTPDSMVSFNTSVMPMLFGSFLIVIGNTGFPIMLRFTIWISSLIVPWGDGLWEEFRFLLDHPRRCFTLLFPGKATWWLFFILIVLNAIDLIFFIILDLKDPTVTSLPSGFQFLDGLYQAVSTRTAGFACVNLADLHPGIQVSYMVMMYISVLPIALSVRQTNVYEENSLGIYHAKSPSQEEDEDEEGGTTRSYLGSHLRRQLSFDLWYIFLGVFVICIVEGGQIEDSTQPGFTIWTIMFEVISAYGTVGLSLGYPNTDTSFSAQFKTLSKLVIIAMMIRGRHRGLPYSLDRAILLPGQGIKSDKLRKKLEEGGMVREMKPEEEHVKSHRSKPRRGWNVAAIVASVMSAGPAMTKTKVK